MKFWSLAFWIGLVLAIAWTALMFVQFVVSQSYHPMAAKGDLLFPLRLGAIAIVVFIAIVMVAIWRNRAPLAARTYQFGLIALLAAAALPILPRVDSGYLQTYYVGEQRHDIPWQLDPSGGDEAIGGRTFSLRAAPDNFDLAYLPLSQSITLTKSTDYNAGRGGDAPTPACETTQRSFNCQWAEGAFVYAARGEIEDLPDDTDSFKTQIIAFLNTFETQAN